MLIRPLSKSSPFTATHLALVLIFGTASTQPIAASADVEPYGTLNSESETTISSEGPDETLGSESKDAVTMNEESPPAECPKRNAPSPSQSGTSYKIDQKEESRCDSSTEKTASEQESTPRAYIEGIDITFEGQRGKLSETSAEHQRSLILNTLAISIGSKYTPALLDSGLKKLSENYENIQVKTKTKHPSPTGNGGGASSVHITLSLQVKPSLRKLHIDGAKRLSLSNLKKELDIKKGSKLGSEFVESISRQAQAYCKKKGYSQATVKTELAINEEDPLNADLHLKIEEGPLAVIKQVELSGLPPSMHRSISKLMKGMVNQKATLTGRFSGRGHYIEDGIEYDRAYLKRALRAEGFCDADVTFKLLPLGRGFKLLGDVNLGNRYYLGLIGIDLKGVEDSQQEIESELLQESLLSQTKLVTGEYYSVEKLEQANDAVMAYLNSRGYADATSYSLPTLRSVDSCVMDIRLVIHPGHIYKIGHVSTSGNEITQERVILHESLVTPGQIYNQARLRATKQRLMNTGFFDAVRIVTKEADTTYRELSLEDFTDASYRFKDVVIDVDENRHNGKFALQLGVVDRDGGYFSIELGERNFNMGGIKDIPRKGFNALKGNGEYMSIKSLVTIRRYQHDLSWTLPHFLDSPWTLGLQYSIGTARSKTYDQRSRGASIFGVYPLHDFLNLKISGALKKEFIEAKEDAEERIVKQERFNGWTAHVASSLIYDSTNQMLYPSKGKKSSVTVGLTELFETETLYLKTLVHNSYYFPLADKITLKARFDVDLIYPFEDKSAEDISISQRVFVGGERSVRGYRYGTLGPLYADGTGQGGLSSYEGSVEILHRLHPQIAGFAFIDSGVASSQKLQFNKPYTSVGWGLRIDLMQQIPIAIGYGYPLHTESRSQAKKFFFTIGSQF